MEEGQNQIQVAYQQHQGELLSVADISSIILKIHLAVAPCYHVAGRSSLSPCFSGNSSVNGEEIGTIAFPFSSVHSFHFKLKSFSQKLQQHQTNNYILFGEEEGEFKALQALDSDSAGVNRVFLAVSTYHFPIQADSPPCASCTLVVKLGK